MKKVFLFGLVIVSIGTAAAFVLVRQSGTPLTTTSGDPFEQSEVVRLHKITMPNGTLSSVMVHVSGQLRRPDGDRPLVRVVSMVCEANRGGRTLLNSSALPVFDLASKEAVTFTQKIQTSSYDETRDLEDFIYDVRVSPRGTLGWGDVKSDEDIDVQVAAQ